MALRLRYSNTAYQSLLEIEAYLVERNPVAASSVIGEIELLCGLVAEFPEMGRRIEGTRLRYHVTRKYRYRVVYRIEAESLDVVDVMHPRQTKGD